MFKRQSGNAFVPSTTSYSPCPPGSLTFCNSSTDEAVSRYPQTRSSSLRLNRSHVCRDSLLYFARAEQGRGPVLRLSASARRQAKIAAPLASRPPVPAGRRCWTRVCPRVKQKGAEPAADQTAASLWRPLGADPAAWLEDASF